MANGAEVGQGHISLFPEMKGFRSAVNKEMQDAGKSGSNRFSKSFDGNKIGKSFGGNFKNSFNDAASSLGKDALKPFQRDVAQATSKASAALLNYRQSTINVQAAQDKLNAAIAKYGPESTQAQSAAVKLEQAQLRQADALAKSNAAAEAKAQATKTLKAAEEELANTSAKSTRGFAALANSFKIGVGNIANGNSAFSGAAKSLMNLGGAFEKSKSTVTGWASTLQDKAKSAFDKMPEGAKTAASTAIGAFGKLGSATASVFGAVGSRITGTFSNVGSAVMEKMSALGSSIGSALQTAASAGLKAVTAAGAAAGAGIAVAGKQALDAYATWEQAVGGVDTLFKSASGTVQKYAAEAYKTAGVSANDYMNQVTSFAASLVQSLGGDTAKAAELGNMALVDMSDNANKMGTDLGSLQWAYQGFAKQNYTMLDNLKLGYGGTQEEMKRLIQDASKMTDIQKELGVTVDGSSMSFANVVSAIHVMQKSLDIAGTTSREAATTIEGSIGMMKAAWQNWLAGLGNENADMGALSQQLADSIGTALKNIVPRLSAIAKGVVSAIPALFDSLVSLLPAPFQEAVAKVLDVISRIRDGFLGLKDLIIAGNFTAAFRNAFNVEEDSPVIDFLFKIRDTAKQVADAIPGLFKGIGQKISSVFQAIGPTVSTVFNGIVALVTNIKTTFEQAFANNGGDLGGLGHIAQTVMGLASPLGVVITMFQQFGSQIQQVVQQAGPSLYTMLDNLAAMLGGALAGILPGIQSAIQSLLPVIGQVITTVGNIVSAILPTLSSMIRQLTPVITQVASVIGQIMSIVAPLVAQLVSSVLPVIQNIITAVMNLVNAAMPAITGLAQIVMSAIQTMLPVIQAVLTVVTAVISGVVSAIGTVITIITNVVTVIVSVIGSVISVISGLYASVSSVFTAINTFIAGVISTIVSVVSSAFNGLVNTIGGAVNTAGSVISGFFGTVSSIFQSIGSTISNAISNAAAAVRSGFSGMVSAASSAISGVVSAVSGLPGKIMGFFSNAGSWLIDSGRAIIQGLIDGITGMIGAAGDAIGDVMDKIASFLPHSPAKEGAFSGRGWTPYSGRALVRGLAEGMDSAAPSAVSSIRGVMRDINGQIGADGRLGVNALNVNGGSYMTGATGSALVDFASMLVEIRGLRSDLQALHGDLGPTIAKYTPSMTIREEKRRLGLV